MTNVLARLAVACSAALLVACGETGGGGNVNTGVCAAGEFRCTGDVLETCSVDRMGFTTVATCQAGLCDAVGKQCDNCKAGEGTCTGASAGKLCSADGQKLEDVSCSGATPFCAASGTKAACVACRASTDCAPSTNPCALSVCGADGTCGTTAVAANTACGANGGKCDGAGSCRECTADQKRCAGLQPESCDSNGKWVASGAMCGGSSPLCVGGECAQCATAADCPASANACTQAVCSSGVCGYTAKAQGTPCPGGTCNAGGVCNACTPGTKVCNGNQVLSCNAGGQFDPPVTCGGATPYCNAATGVCVECGLASQCPAPSNPCLQASCSGNTCGISMRADGTSCTVGTDSGTCSAGICSVCANGTTRCKPGVTTTPQQCASGQWVDQSVCVGSDYCSAGTCTTGCTFAKFNGSSSKIKVTALPSLTGNSARTITLWMRQRSVRSQPLDLMSLLTLGSGIVDGTRFSLLTSQSRQVALIGQGNDVWSASGQFSLGVWTHLAAVYTGGTVKMYVDGVEVLSQAKSYSTNWSLPLIIGSNSEDRSDEWFDGDISDVRFWSRGLSVAEIAVERSFRIVVSTQSLEGWWKLSDTSGSYLDSSGQGRHGVGFNMASGVSVTCW